MIVRDGRNVRHDLGPRPQQGNRLSELAVMFRPMREGETWMTTKSRGFFDKNKPRTPSKTDHRAARLADPDKVREQDRIRCRRYRQGETYKARRAAMRKRHDQTL